MVKLFLAAIVLLAVMLAGCTPVTTSGTTSKLSTDALPEQRTQFDLSQTFYKSPNEIDRIFGTSTGGHKLKADASNRGRIPGELREYGKGTHWQYALVRFYKNKCVSVQLELTKSYETAEDALASFGIDVTSFMQFAEVSPMATRWRSKKIGSYLFKDVSAYRQDLDGKFNFVQFELVDPD